VVTEFLSGSRVVLVESPPHARRTKAYYPRYVITFALTATVECPSRRRPVPVTGYRTGAFAKTLLASVSRFGEDNTLPFAP